MSVVVLEIVLISFVKKYYYDNLEETLTNQIKISADFYVRYFSNSSLEENILANVDTFWRQTTSQVQIIDNSGKLLMDSIGYMPKDNNIDTGDVIAALDGMKGKWIGAVPYDSDRVMAISYPLIVDGEIIGIIRFISSVQAVNKEIRSIAFIFIVIGMLVMLFSMGLSIVIANGIIDPIRHVTYIAGKMADGDFDIRSTRRSPDEIGKLSDTLNYMADEILKREQLKDEFLSSVSHELRTPLTSIKGWAATLNSGGLDDRQLLQDGLDIIEKESDRLTIMVEELLDFSRFASGKIKLRKKTVDIGKSIDHVKDQMDPLARRNDINFVVEHGNDLPKVYIDENRIKQVLINIIDNAIKFTPKDHDIVIKSCYDEEFVNISIKDTGCGIEEEDLPRVKEKFFKGKNSKSQHGIGLAICDEIMALHGGRLDIDSEIDKGTIVNVRIPATGE